MRFFMVFSIAHLTQPRPQGLKAARPTAKTLGIPDGVEGLRPRPAEACTAYNMSIYISISISIGIHR
jgi:hypothetical protein